MGVIPDNCSWFTIHTIWDGRPGRSATIVTFYGDDGAKVKGLTFGWGLTSFEDLKNEDALEDLFKSNPQFYKSDHPYSLTYVRQVSK